jgi:hypothetical protein
VLYDAGEVDPWDDVAVDVSAIEAHVRHLGAMPPDWIAPESQFLERAAHELLRLCARAANARMNARQERMPL